MPVTLQALATNRAAASIDCGDGAVLAVHYYPQRVTAQMMADFAALETLKTQSDERAMALMLGVTDTLLTILADWDLVESIAEDGTVGPAVPLDRAHMAQLGFGLQVQLMNGVIGAMQHLGESRASEVATPVSA